VPIGIELIGIAILKRFFAAVDIAVALRSSGLGQGYVVDATAPHRAAASTE